MGDGADSGLIRHSGREREREQRLFPALFHGLHNMARLPSTRMSANRGNGMWERWERERGRRPSIESMTSKANDVVEVITESNIPSFQWGAGTRSWQKMKFAFQDRTVSDRSYTAGFSPSFRRRCRTNPSILNPLPFPHLSRLLPLYFIAVSFSLSRSPL